MRYFELDTSTNLHEIGNYPQIQSFKKGYDPNRIESCSQIARYFFGKEPNVVVDFDCLLLAKKAILTDYLSCSYLNHLAGMLVSERLYNFISNLRIPGHIVYSTGIYRNEVIVSRDYKWIHYTTQYSHLIEYKNSNFFLDHFDANFKALSIRSYDDYLKEKERTRYWINSKKLALSQTANEFDVLRLGVVRSEPYVTEGVKARMIDEGFTGIDYKLADYLVAE